MKFFLFIYQPKYGQSNQLLPRIIMADYFPLDSNETGKTSILLIYAKEQEDSLPAIVLPPVAFHSFIPPEKFFTLSKPFLASTE